MDFDLTEDQKEIKRTAKDLLAARSPWEAVRAAAEAGAYADALSAELGELGWPGIAVAEAHGGQDLGAVELTVLLEELGYACASTPFLGTAAAARRSRPAAPTPSGPSGCPAWRRASRRPASPGAGWAPMLPAPPSSSSSTTRGRGCCLPRTPTSRRRTRSIRPAATRGSRARASRSETARPSGCSSRSRPSSWDWRSGRWT